jgi:hypothetical protein
LTVREGVQGLVLRAFGSDGPDRVDWGEVPAVPHLSPPSGEIGGFTARYDFGHLQTDLAANLKYGVLVIQSYNRFLDGRPPYFTREFFHQDLGGEPPTPPAPAAETIPCRTAADWLPTGRGPGGPVDLAPLLGSWRNTYRHSRGIRRVILSQRSGEYWLAAEGVGCDADWGEARAVPYATQVAGRQPAGFLACFAFGFADWMLAANEAKGLLIIASYATFRDGSGRSSYFTREFFYRELTGP